jgi:broad specificity phosphatase PhoE
MARALWIARHASRRDLDDPGWAPSAVRPFDPPLSARGRREAAAMAERLAGEGIRRLFSSPFLRCMETAAALAARLELVISVEPGLSEWLNAAWFEQPPRLLAPAELVRRFPVDAGYRARGTARHGESGEEALRRSGDTALRLAAEFDAGLVLVGHGASVRGALAALAQIAPEQAGELGYGCLVELVPEGPRWRRGRTFDARAPGAPAPGPRGTG